MSTSSPSSPQEESSTQSAEPAGEGATADAGADTRAKFRAALERKQGRNAAGVGAASGGKKSQGAHGAAGSKRVFRRKSG